MPLFVMLLMMVTSVPAKVPPMTEVQKMERQREELRVLKEKHGNDADKRMSEHMRVL